MIVVKVIGLVALAAFTAVCELRRQLIGEPWPGLRGLLRGLRRLFLAS